MRRWARTAGTVSLWASLALGVAVSAGGELRLREPGETLPPMTLYDLDGRPHTLAPGGGEVPMLLFFWSVSCPDCREAMPGLAAFHTSEQSRGVLVWAINVNGQPFSNSVRAYATDMELPFPVLYDRLEGDSLVAADPLGVSRTPTLYLAGADGKIVLRQVIRLDLEAVARAVSVLAR